MMDLDSAIQHCKEQVQEQAKKGCYSCAEEHQQLAEWLKELKAYRNKSEIPNTCGDAISREHLLEEIALLKKSPWFNENTYGSKVIRKEAVEIVEDVCIKREPSVIPQPMPCGDAVSRQAVLDIITFEDKWLFDAKSHNKDTEIAFSAMKSKISEMPSVSPQQRTGWWIAQDIHNCHTDFRCSECGYIHNFMHLYGEPTADYTYCPQCGAKMEVEE